MTSLSYDDSSGIILSRSGEAWAPEEFEAYLKDYLVFRERSRKRNGRVLHLVETDGETLQSQALFGQMSNTVALRGDANDRTAIAIKSMLSKMQISRLPNAETRRFFTNLEDAKAWLLAEAAKPLARSERA